jgi:hypothetical protein
MKNITSIFLISCFSTLILVTSTTQISAQVNQLDAALVHPKDKNIVYLFSGNNYYRYDWVREIGGEPRSNSTYWKGVPSKVDAALNHPTDNNVVYLFSGTQYYRYNWSADKVEAGFPKSTAALWKGLPSKIDAALNHPTDKNIVYLFSGTQYYRYNWSADKVEDGFPKSTAALWKGLPSKIDAALNHPTDKNIVYLFSGTQYYRYNWSADRVDAGYPLNTSQNWKVQPVTQKIIIEPIQRHNELVPSTEEIPLAGMNYSNRTFWLSTSSKGEYFLGKSGFILGNKDFDFANIDNRVSITYYPGNDINLNGYVIFFSSKDRADRSYLAKQSNGLVSAYGRLTTNNRKNKNFYWNFIPKDKGYIIQNLASGLYLSTQSFGSTLGFAEVSKDKAATFLLESCDDDTFLKTPRRYLGTIESQVSGKTISIIPPHLFGSLSLDEMKILGNEIEFLEQSGWKLADLEKLKELYAIPKFRVAIKDNLYWTDFPIGRDDNDFRVAWLNSSGIEYLPDSGNNDNNLSSFVLYWR